MAETSKVKQYFQKCFNKKLLIQKGIIAGAALVLVLALSLSFYLWLKDKEGTIGRNGFWYIQIDWNTKGGLGGNLSTGAILALQSIMFVVLLAIYLLVSHDKITSSFVALAMFGGLFNLFQRASDWHETKAVLDYFIFGPWIKFDFIFNWPDIFVVIGIFGFVISYVTLTIMEAVRESRKEKIKRQQAKAVDANQPEQKVTDEQPKQQQ